MPAKGAVWCWFGRCLFGLRSERLKKRLYVVVLVASVTLTLLSGCSESSAPQATVVFETPADAADAVVINPSETPNGQTGESEGDETAGVEPATTLTAEPEPTEAPTATPIVVADVDSACVDCHTDEERLKVLAVEPEEVELSSGEG